MPIQFHSQHKIENGHGDGVWSIAWSEGNIVSGSTEGILKLWSLKDNKPTAVFTSKKQKVGITSVVALQGGTMAIACYQDAMIRFFDLVNKTEKATITSGLFDAYSLALSPGEDVLVSGNSHGEINIWSMQEGYEKIGSLPTQSRFILNTTFSIDGKLSTSSIDGAIHLFDMNTQQLIYKHDYHSLPVRSTAFSPNGDLLYSVSDDRQMMVFDLKSGSVIQRYSNDTMLYSIDTAADHRHSVMGTANGKVLLYDLGMQKRIAKYDQIHSEAVWSVKFTNQGLGDNIVGGGELGSDTAGATQDSMFSSESGSQSGHIYSYLDGMKFATASDDSTIHVFKAN